MPRLSGPCASGPYVANGLLAHPVGLGQRCGCQGGFFVLKDVDSISLGQPCTRLDSTHQGQEVSVLSEIPYGYGWKNQSGPNLVEEVRSHKATS